MASPGLGAFRSMGHWDLQPDVPHTANSGEAAEPVSAGQLCALLGWQTPTLSAASLIPLASVFLWSGRGQGCSDVLVGLAGAGPVCMGMYVRHVSAETEGISLG